MKDGLVLKKGLRRVFYDILEVSEMYIMTAKDTAWSNELSGMKERFAAAPWGESKVSAGLF